MKLDDIVALIVGTDEQDVKETRESPSTLISRPSDLTTCSPSPRFPSLARTTETRTRIG